MLRAWPLCISTFDRSHICAVMYIVVEGQFEILFTRSVPSAAAQSESALTSTAPFAAPSAAAPSAAAPSAAPAPASSAAPADTAAPNASAASALVDHAAYTKPLLQRELTQVLVVATLGRGATLGAASFLLDDVSPSATVRA